jgi:hypothetical protein
MLARKESIAAPDRYNLELTLREIREMASAHGKVLQPFLPL